jgi:ParB-like chromosome segregation protein Spo0J
MPSRKTIPPNLLNEPQSKNVDSTKPYIQMLDVPDLCPHPRQAELVGDMPAAEFEALVAHIAANGIRNPLIVMADGKTVVCGHQRLRAARQLGIKTIACIVRADFVEADDPRVIEALLSDNLRRRQLGSLEKARYTKTLFEIELGHRLEPENSSDWHNKIAVRDSVGRILGCSGRNAARYLAVVSTPPAVQEAFGAGMLPLALAASVGFLRPDALERLAGSIRKLLARPKDKKAKKAKDEIKALVEAALAKSRRPKPAVIHSPVRVLRNINDCLDANLREAKENFKTIVSDLREDDVSTALGPEAVDILRSVRLQVVHDLRERSDRLSQLVVQLEESLALPPAPPNEQCA